MKLVGKAHKATNKPINLNIISQCPLQCQDNNQIKTTYSFARAPSLVENHQNGLQCQIHTYQYQKAWKDGRCVSTLIE